MKIAAGHNMYFPAKDLYNKIERLRNQSDMQELKKENTELKKTVTRITSLVHKKEITE